ncbi:MAG: hypothetical protein HY013_02490 [Candidatus Solibacter usitatus]|nr:hypothetical protein [Candidatus Solibacter usitatus]
MLHRFRVSNFKSLVNAEFRPAGINLVVGPNNAGKTNLCHALRFLALATRTPLDEAARLCTAEPWNLLNVYSGADSLELEANCTLTSEAEELNFGYILRLTTGPNGVSRSLAVCSEVLRVTGGELNDQVLLENTAGKVGLFHEQSPDPDPYVQTTAPNTATMLCRLYDLETNRLANLFKRYLGSWGYYNFDPLSDGTLRFLAMCYLIVAHRQEGSSTPGPRGARLEVGGGPETTADSSQASRLTH